MEAEGEIMNDTTHLRVNKRYKKRLETQKKQIEEIFKSDITMGEFTKILSVCQDNVVVVMPRKKKSKIHERFISI